MSGKYNGHRSWNAWNVHLWMTNDEVFYFLCRDLIRQHGKEKTARILAKQLKGKKTPDGATYNKTCIMEALRGFDN